ncbi:MAG: SAM-dependent methyltransferase [Betaproteobacteria bacterium]|nr:SAM-dependent methyltransferase [Betaproteobacteria bacterium]MDE2622221.1 SAM-dependent methyltransferase [Betaproteobacteria bacterium]
MAGRLILLPTPLVEEGGGNTLPEVTLGALRTLGHFVVENAKTARRVLKACGHPGPLQSIAMAVLDEHTREGDLPALLEPLRQGHDVGLMSEAGCPAVADPGARLVRLAHAEGIQVVPMPGPSALLLALMASGLEGQRFAFQGYLPVDAGARRSRIQQLEQRSRRERETQILIETPYRNEALWTALLETLQPGTLLCAAFDLTAAAETVRTAPVATWRNAPAPSFARRPSVFLFLA